MDEPKMDRDDDHARTSSEGADASMSLASRRVVLGVTGSIAAYKAAELVRLLKKAGAEVQVLMTQGAIRFVSPLTMGTLSEQEVLVNLFPENEQGSWTKHVQMGLWADVMVVAPATATTLAKLASGICDSMLTATALSRRCPMIVCPAMDHDMYGHPATQRNLAILRQDGVQVMDPEYGLLASGLTGDGRLAEPEAILSRISKIISSGPAGGARLSMLSGKTVLVTAGPTREAIDPVRFVSNGSTGTMGFAIAAEAASRGANVTLVAGPTSLPTPPGVRRFDVVTAEEMYEAAMEHSGADIVIAVAAVSDYAPAEVSELKVKKEEGEIVLRLRRTPDILSALGAQKRLGQTLVGFALETHDGEVNARAKLRAKRLDWIVLNQANEPGSGFGEETNRVTVIPHSGPAIALPMMDKREVARELLDQLTQQSGETSTRLGAGPD